MGGSRFSAVWAKQELYRCQVKVALLPNGQKRRYAARIFPQDTWFDWYLVQSKSPYWTAVASSTALYMEYVMYEPSLCFFFRTKHYQYYEVRESHLYPPPLYDQLWCYPRPQNTIVLAANGTNQISISNHSCWIEWRDLSSNFVRVIIAGWEHVSRRILKSVRSSLDICHSYWVVHTSSTLVLQYESALEEPIRARILSKKNHSSWFFSIPTAGVLRAHSRFHKQYAYVRTRW